MKDKIMIFGVMCLEFLAAIGLVWLAAIIVKHQSSAAFEFSAFLTVVSLWIVFWLIPKTHKELSAGK